jgi:uncharacterized protein (TIGR01244 family)
MTSRVLSLAGLIIAIAAMAIDAGAIPASVDPQLVVNYVVARPGVAFSGRLAPEGIARLKGLGFKTVLNLRTEQEGAKDEEAAVRALGLRYEWVPVTPDTLSLADVERVETVLGDASAAPVLFHCASANRVAGVWAIIRVRCGKSVTAAIEETRPLGLRSQSMIAAVERLVAAQGQRPRGRASRTRARARRGLCG